MDLVLIMSMTRCWRLVENKKHRDIQSQAVRELKVNIIIKWSNLSVFINFLCLAPSFGLYLSSVSFSASDYILRFGSLLMPYENCR